MHTAHKCGRGRSHVFVLFLHFLCVCGRIPEIRLALEGAASRPQRKDRERTRERHMQHAQQAKSASMLADIYVHQYVPYIQRKCVHVNVADLHWS